MHTASVLLIHRGQHVGLLEVGQATKRGVAKILRYEGIAVGRAWRDMLGTREAAHSCREVEV